MFIFDFGGGTLDCTIMSIYMRDGYPTYKVISTNGNSFWGGVNIENVICDYILKELKRFMKN